MAIKKYGPGGPSDTKYVMNKSKKDGSGNKHKEISKKRFDRVSKRYAKQEGSKSLGTDTSAGQQVISGRNPNKSVSRMSYGDGGSVTKWSRKTARRGRTM